MGPIEFDKYEALGNDFLVIDAAAAVGVEPRALAPGLCDRRRGVGADGLLWVEVRGGEARVTVVNADGGIAETSGNGLRCAARWLLDRGLADPTRTIPLVSGAGPSPARVVGDEIAVDMGPPVVGIVADPETREPLGQRILVCGEVWDGISVSMGNPHLVLRSDRNPADSPLARIAEGVAAGGDFPDGVNIELARVDRRDRVTARVWERGVGETQACGSGACAIVAALRAVRQVDDEVDVHMPGGRLRVAWGGGDHDPAWLTGPARRVFSGTTEGGKMGRASGGSKR